MMKSISLEVCRASIGLRTAARLPPLLLLLGVVMLLGGAPDASAQKTKAQKLPSPDKIVGDYLKASGGKQGRIAVRDATYEWSARQGEAGARGTARTFTKFPGATRTDLVFAGGETNAATNVRSAWLREAGGRVRTLTDAEANVAKLLSALDASRLADYKKQDVFARTVEFTSKGANASDPAYVVEFSRRNGARLLYWFSAQSKMPVQVSDDTRGLTILYSDYRKAQNGRLEPHQVDIKQRGAEPLALTLQSASFTTGLADALFEPPSDGSLNISELLRAVASNQAQLDRRVSDYTYTRTETEREIDDKGVVKREKTVVHEIYPVEGGGRVLKLISEDGVPLSPERAAKEERRVAEALGKVARENEKRISREQRERAARARKKGETGAGADGDEDVGIGVFLRACEFVSPRRERFQDRNAIVFDFRPRPNFKPANRGESVVAKLAGVAWIDPTDKQVMRLEARLSEGFKIGGGLLASVRPGSAVVLEQTRLADGVWLSRFSQINASAKLFLFASFRLDAIREYSDYKRFSTNVGDAKVEPPPAPPPDEP